MAILEKDIQTPEIETRRAKSQDFAFFMPGMMDCSDTALLRNEIINYAHLVNRFHVERSPLKDSMQIGLDESLDRFKESIASNVGGMLLLTTRGSISATEKNIAALRDVFSCGSVEEQGRQRFIIPTDKITAVRALGYAASEGAPDPVLSIRVQTGHEQPTSYFAGPGVTAELESPGSWYQFKFSDINVGLLAPIPEVSVA